MCLTERLLSVSTNLLRDGDSIKGTVPLCLYLEVNPLDDNIALRNWCSDFGLNIERVRVSGGISWRYQDHLGVVLGEDQLRGPDWISFWLISQSSRSPVSPWEEVWQATQFSFRQSECLTPLWRASKQWSDELRWSLSITINDVCSLPFLPCSTLGYSSEEPSQSPIVLLECGLKMW